MILIGLNGRLHSGKDTAFSVIERLAATQGLVAHRMGFADKMKLSGVRALGYDPVDLADALDEANDIKEHAEIVVRRKGPKRRFRRQQVREQVISGREFWQRYGTEAHREVYGQNFHVDALLPVTGEPPVLALPFPDTDVLVITDVRFPNEASRIRVLGGQVWYINADGRLGPLLEGSHISEHGLPGVFIDQVVYNNDDLAIFESNLEKAWAAL